MSIKTKPNLDGLTPAEQDTTSTADTVYSRYGSGTRNEYIERQLTVSPYTNEWTWGNWSRRTFMTNWVDINQRTIEF